MPAGAFAGYHITYQDKTVETACFWILKSRLYMCEGGEPLALSEVSAILPGQFTQLETELHKDAMRRFWTYVSWLLDREADLMEQDNATWDSVEGMGALKALPEKSHDLNELKTKNIQDIRCLFRDVDYLGKSWSALRVMSRSHVQLLEVKTLQMIAWKQSLEERRLYLETGDPTYREYTLEHMRQVRAFQESFMRVLEKVTGEE